MTITKCSGFDMTNDPDNIFLVAVYPSLSLAPPEREKMPNFQWEVQTRIWTVTLWGRSQWEDRYLLLVAQDQPPSPLGRQLLPHEGRRRPSSLSDLHQTMADMLAMSVCVVQEWNVCRGRGRLISAGLKMNMGFFWWLKRLKIKSLTHTNQMISSN